MTPIQLTSILLLVIVVPVMTWQGLSCIKSPKRWLERHGRSTADKHIRAVRFIGWMFLAGVLLSVLQWIRSL